MDSYMVFDGLKLQEFVEDNEGFAKYVDERFEALDKDQNGRLSPKELRPAVAAIGAALGLPAQGSSPDADIIYDQVMEKIVKPAAESCGFHELIINVSAEEFVEALRSVVLKVASRLEKSPVTVAHSKKIYDGKSIQKFVKNKDEVDKALQTTWKSLPKDPRGTLPREYLRVALDMIGPPAGLPPLGAVEQVDGVVSEIFKMVEADEGGVLKQNEFNKLLLQILGSLMLQLEGNPITVSSNAPVKSQNDDSDSDTFLPRL